ncbi:MAG: HAMP domain-containing sensor histidine kinase [Acutalibacteraceae bacterium]|nr:HAMP domain-containing sensor histidine kinase [Acutalibacteraceae bacterium]
MTGKKSLFAQYLTISLIIVLLSFVILGTMLVFFVARYSSEEKQSLLIENANQVADLVSEKTVTVNDSVYVGKEETEWITSIIETVSLSINADVFVTDQEGNTLLCSNKENCTHIKATIPAENFDTTNQKEIFISSDLGGVYESPHYVAVVPVTAEVGKVKEPVGFVIAATETTAFSDFTGEITKIFFYAAIATFAIVVCIMWFFSYKMIKPLRQMSIAARRLANDDFSVRVPVTSSNEIGTLAKTFNEMADSLAMSESTRRNFIANVSHELKTPMTTIAGFIDGILDGTIPPEKQKQYLRIVSTEVKRLSRLVASMLSLSRIDNGELRVKNQEFNLSEVVISTLLTFEQKIEERHIDIQGLETCTTPSIVEGDPDLIHQVVYNLFENAVKFVDVGGYIKVTLTEYNDRTELEIKNSGHGIEPEELVHIFERFYKTDKSRSQDKNGMGLGLYIVKTIMRLHGGDITAQSIVDEYCSFTLWLPKNTAQSNMHNLFTSRKKDSSATMVSSDGTIISTAQTIEEHIEE